MVDLTKDNFEEEVLKAEGTVLVDFYGDGCVPCQALMPHIHAMEGDYGDKIKFTSLNTTKARRLAIGQKILVFLLSLSTRAVRKLLSVLRTTQRLRTSRL